MDAAATAMQVAELLAGVTAPVVYWEQGTEWLFGDPIRFQVSRNINLYHDNGAAGNYLAFSVYPILLMHLRHCIVQVAQNYLKQDQLFHMVLHLPCALAGVSTAVQSILSQEFGRNSLLIPNGIDCARFSPGPRSGPAPAPRLTLAADGVRACYCCWAHIVDVDHVSLVPLTSRGSTLCIRSLHSLC